MGFSTGSLPKACRDSGWLALRPCHATAYDLPSTKLSSTKKASAGAVLVLDTPN